MPRGVDDDAGIQASCVSVLLLASSSLLLQGIECAMRGWVYGGGGVSIALPLLWVVYYLCVHVGGLTLGC